MKRSPFKSLTNAFIQILEAFSFCAQQIIGKPLNAIARAIGKIFEQDQVKKLESDGPKSRRQTGFLLTTWFLRPLGEIIKFFYRAFVATAKFPFQFIRHLWSQTRSEFFWCVPTLIAFFIIFFVVSRVFVQKGDIQREYRNVLSKSLIAGDFEYAKTICYRLITWETPPRQNDRLNLAICMLQTGEIERGNQILDDLAPNDSVGYAPAHRLKAIIIGSRLSQTQDPKLLSPLYFHLTNAKDTKSEQIQSVFGTYYIESKQPLKAIEYLKLAAKKNPIHYLRLASIYGSNNEPANRQQMLREAAEAFQKVLEDQPTNHEVRIQLATVLSNLERKEEAEATLLQGKLLKNDETINRALADFAIMLHDQATDLDVKLALIQKSLNYDINYVLAYQRLVEQFRWSVKENPERANELENLLMENIATGKSTALSHFAASSLYSIKGDSTNSKFHIERAFELNSEFGIIGNNLAWLLAHDPNTPDLIRANELASDVVEKFPSNNRFRDTLATILLLDEKYEEACTQFEIILENTGNEPQNGQIHQKLSKIYEKLNKPELAKIHERLSMPEKK